MYFLNQKMQKKKIKTITLNLSKGIEEKQINIDQFQSSKLAKTK